MFLHAKTTTQQNYRMKNLENYDQSLSNIEIKARNMQDTSRATPASNRDSSGRKSKITSTSPKMKHRKKVRFKTLRRL